VNRVWVFLLGSLALALAAVWVALAPSFVAWPGARPVRYETTTADGWTLAVWHRAAAPQRFVEPVVLCHGLANNAGIFDFLPQTSLAESLAAAGFEVYSLNLRGADGSRGPDLGPLDADFDDHLQRDLPALLSFVQRHSGQPRLFWVGHSLGGLLGLVGAATTARAQIVGLVSVAAPLFFRLHPHVRALLRLGRHLAAPAPLPLRGLAAAVAPFAGRWALPLRQPLAPVNLAHVDAVAQRVALAHVITPIWRGVLAQLDDWARRDAFSSRDGLVDYRGLVATLSTPLLVVGGSADALAPPEVCRATVDLVSAPDRGLKLLGREFGHGADYGHGDLLIGARASAELFPAVAAWLVRRATPLP
jgi:pimeloyl-ACP methyl ester carboxylesterase